MTGHGLTVAHAGFAVTDGQAFLRAGDGYVEETAFFIQCAFHLAAGVRQQAFFQSDDEDVRILQALATVHRDERDGIAFHFLVFSTLGVESHLFHELDQAVLWLGRAARCGIERGNEFRDIFHPVFGRLGVFLGLAQVIQITGLGQEIIRPTAKGKGVVGLQGLAHFFDEGEEFLDAFLDARQEGILHIRVAHGGID